MSIKDELISKYFFTLYRYKRNRNSKSENPRDVKMKLAYEIVKIYHGEKEAKKQKRIL